MSNIMQYLIQMNDEARDSYEDINRQLINILDKVEVLAFKVEELESRANINNQTEQCFPHNNTYLKHLFCYSSGKTTLL